MSASIELSVLLALSLLVGLGALFQIHCRGSRFLWGGRAGAGGGANTIPQRRSCTRLVIGILSVMCIVNAIVAFMGKWLRLGAQCRHKDRPLPAGERGSRLQALPPASKFT